MSKKIKEFKFKTEKPTGKWRAFDNPAHYIKFDGKVVGAIGHEKPFRIDFTVMKTEADMVNDTNKNCPWKRIYIKKESETLDEAKEYVNTLVEYLTGKYTFHMSDI